jgi:hypothetical protein
MNDGLATPSTGRAESAALSYIDLLYAVPVAGLATRLGSAPPSNVSAAGWFDVAVALSAVTLGWVGHHINRQLLPEAAQQRGIERPFTTARFPQLVVEILIIGAYFALVMLAVLHGSPGSQLPKAIWLAVAFGLYLVWDLLDIGVAKSLLPRPWIKRATTGMHVTATFLLLFAAVVAVAALLGGHPPQAMVMAFDGVVILLLYLYRVVQERACRDDTTAILAHGTTR